MDWLDDRTLPSRMKFRARHALREFLVGWVVGAILAAVLLHDPTASLLANSIVVLAVGAVLGIGCWLAYKVLRFALGG